MPWYRTKLESQEGLKHIDTTVYHVEFLYFLESQEGLKQLLYVNWNNHRHFVL